MSSERSSRPGASSPRGNAEVVTLSSRGNGQRSPVAMQIRAAREQLGTTPTEFADYLRERTNRKIYREQVENWEKGASSPASVLWECLLITGGIPISAGMPLLDHVPGAFPARILAGPWVTAYQFTHAGKPHFHADIAHVTADGERSVHVVNHPPEPRTQGRTSPFRNEIEGQLFGRHLIGVWRNKSDTRYYGSLHLAVLPGETVMDGHYTGLASDIAVSVERWRWVRMEDGSDLSEVRLREPSAIYELVMNRTQDDSPLTAADIREDD